MLVKLRFFMECYELSKNYIMGVLYDDCFFSGERKRIAEASWESDVGIGFDWLDWQKILEELIHYLGTI